MATRYNYGYTQPNGKYPAAGNFSFWTGFYTSRPNLKRRSRELSELFGAMSHQVAQDNLHKFFNGKYLEHKSWLTRTPNQKIDENRQSYERMIDLVSLFTHHDGITGTSADHLVDDYYKRIKNVTKWGNKEHSKLIARQLDVGDLDNNLNHLQWSSVNFANFTINKESYFMVSNPTNVKKQQIELVMNRSRTFKPQIASFKDD